MPPKTQEKTQTKAAREHEDKAVRRHDDKAGSVVRNCPHASYAVIGGEMRCQQCGEPSSKARLVDGVIVRIQPEISCPACGHIFPAPERK